MKRVTRRDTCFSLKLKKSLCRKCRVFQDREDGHGRPIALDETPNCDRIWLKKPKQRPRKMQKLSTLEEMEELNLFFGEDIELPAPNVRYDYGSNLKSFKKGNKKEISSSSPPSKTICDDDSCDSLVVADTCHPCQPETIGDSSQVLLPSSILLILLIHLIRPPSETDNSCHSPLRSSTSSSLSSPASLESDLTQELIRPPSETDNSYHSPLRSNTSSSLSSPASLESDTTQDIKCEDFLVQVKGKEVKIKNVPLRYTVVSKQALSRYKESHNELQKIKKKLTQTRYTPSSISQTFLGKALVMMPKASHEVLQSTIPLLCAFFCSIIGLSIPLEKIASICPSRKALSESVAQYATSSYLRALEVLKQNPYIYILADKANSAKKGSQTATLPKIIAYTNPKTHHIEEFLLDCNASGEDSAEVAKSIIQSLKILQLIDPSLALHVMGQTTDSGGGGTLFALANKLREFHMAGMAENYVVGSCCLHNLQTALRNAIIEISGEGGMDSETGDYKMNAMQLMHGMYNLHNYVPSHLYAKLWKKACDELQIDVPYKILPAPIVTRWWSVGVCAASLEDDWEIRKKVNNALLNLPNSDTSDALRKILSANKNLMGKMEIKSDIKIIAAIHRNWLCAHFDFVQGGDPLTGNVAGYQARLMTVRFFLMHQDLSACTDEKWKDMEDYKNVIDFNSENLDLETQLIQDKKIAHAFTYMLRSIEKHFDPWVNRHLPFAIFSERETAKVVASFLLNVENDDSQLFHSELQGREINVKNFREFLYKRCTTKNEIVQTDEFKQHTQQISLIQQGIDLWQDNLPSLLHDFRSHYILHLASFPTNSHMAERAVKLSNHCSIPQRQDLMRSLCAIGNFDSVKKCNKRSREVYQQTTRRKSTPDDREIVRTKTKGNVLIIHCIDEDNNSVNNHNKKIKQTILTAKENQYSSVRDTAFLTSYDAHHNVPRSTSNQLENRPGVTRTALISNKVLFKKMLKDPFRPHILSELSARGITPTDNELRNYNKLLTRLKTDEGNKTSFFPRTAYENFKWW